MIAVHAQDEDERRAEHHALCRSRIVQAQLSERRRNEERRKLIEAAPSHERKTPGLLKMQVAERKSI